MLSHCQRRFLCVNLALFFVLQIMSTEAVSPIKVSIIMKKPYVGPNGADADTPPALLTYANAGAGTVTPALNTQFCLLFKTALTMAGNDLAAAYDEQACKLEAIGQSTADNTKATLTGSIYFTSTEASNRLTATNFLIYLIAGQALGWGPITGAPGAAPIPLAFVYMAVKNAANALNPAGNDVTVTVTGTSVSSLAGAKNGANQYSTNAMLVAGVSLIPAGLYRLLSQQC